MKRAKLALIVLGLLLGLAIAVASAAAFTGHHGHGPHGQGAANRTNHHDAGDANKAGDDNQGDDDQGGPNTTMRWDIISVNFATGTLSAGGQASALANDNSKITLTGSGTFHSNPGNAQAVSGGGNWTTYATNGTTVTGSGSYTVEGFVSFILAPGTPPLPHDNIGNLADNRAGLLVLRIAYSHGSDGTLIVSCHLVGTSDAVFEGVTASKGYVDYWNRVAPVANVDGNRTTFHILHSSH
jgi:hypothetical protein